MSSIDVEQLLRDISPDAPCGADLEYDAAFMEMTRNAAGKPAQQMGGQIIPAEEPNWRDVRDQCKSLFSRTKDLRIAVFLTRALAHTDGLGGFADGLALCQGLIERYWDNVHPKLDPDDANDPTLRVNTLGTLADRDQTLLALRNTPLAVSRRVGKFGLREVEIANGTIPKPENADSVVDMSTIEAAFLDMDATELQDNADAVTAALQWVGGLDDSLGNQVGGGNSADFTPLKGTLRSMNQLLQQQLGRRGLASGEGMAAEGGEAGFAPGMGGMPAMSGTLQSREDVIRVLDQVCDWYSKYEPSSPVPLLLQRAKRLVSKNFMEVIQDLSPSGLTEVQTIAGTEQG